MMDFLAFYGLTEEPFRLTPDSGYFFPSKSHNLGLLSLRYSTDHKEGFCLVTGEPGTGKTTLLNVFTDAYRDSAEIAMVLTPRLSPEEFLLAVLEDLGIRCETPNKNEMLRVFRDFLIDKARENRTVIIIVDEAQNLPDETLEELRLLSNLETEKEKLLHIVLIGQPELVQRLGTPGLRQLSQRIITRIFLAPLEPDEIAHYLAFRLAKAGRGHARFDPPAIKSIYAFSKGIPRVINTIATRALMSAFLQEADAVRLKHVRYAIRSLNLEDRNTSRPLARPMFIASLVLIIILAAASPFVLRAYLEWTGSIRERVLLTGRVADVRPPDPPSPVETPAPKTAAEGVAGETAARETGAPVVSPDEPEPPSVEKGVIITSAANIRETPGLRGRRLYVARRGDIIILVEGTVTMDDIVWQRTQDDRYGEGWISLNVLHVAETD